jgi:hypothetical protein
MRTGAGRDRGLLRIHENVFRHCYSLHRACLGTAPFREVKWGSPVQLHSNILRVWRIVGRIQFSLPGLFLIVAPLLTRDEWVNCPTLGASAETQSFWAV